MDADLIGLFTLLVGLELILGVDNVLVIAILVSRLPEEKRNVTRNFGLILALVARVIMVIGGLKLVQLKEPAFPEWADWFQYSWRDLALLGGGLFLIWKAVKEIHATVELSHQKQNKSAKDTFFGVITQIVILDIVFSLDSVITAVGLTENRWVIIVAVLLSFTVILFFAKPIGDFILKHVALKILALSFLIVIGITIFMEGIGKEVEKSLIYAPIGFAMLIEILQMRHSHNLSKNQVNPPNWLGKYPVLPIINKASPDQALAIAEALLEGGVGIMEITLRTDDAKDSLLAVRREFPEFILGAGSILNSDQLEWVSGEGMEFAVAPGWSDKCWQKQSH